MKSRINYLAVLVCVVFHGAFGAAWFSFWADRWTALLGKTMNDMQPGGSPISYMLSVFQSIMMALLLAWLFGKLRVRSFGDGMRYGFAIGFATIFVAFMTNYSFSMRPVQLALIDCLYPLISLTIMGGILGAWRTKAQKIAELSPQGA